MAAPGDFNFYEDFQAQFRNATIRQLKLAGKQFQKIVEEYSDLATKGPALQKVNQHLADGMREAAVVAYKQNVLQERSAPSYRAGDSNRYAGGKLLRALKDPSMAIGTSKGIGFIDTALLNKSAKQWARLNFGAAPGIGFKTSAHPQPSPRIRFGSGQGISLHLNGGMSSGFRVPQRGTGYFLPEGQFFLGGRVPGQYRKETSSFLSVPSRTGIAPRRFLDQGLVSLAENFGPAYKQHLADALREAVSRGKKGGTTNYGPA